MYLSNPSRCRYCKSSLSYGKRHNYFCSQSCAAKKNNKGNRKWGKEPGACKKCGQKLKSHKRSFCSHTCEWRFKGEELLGKWLRGEVSGAKGKYGEQISPFVRKWLKEKCEGRCLICGGNEWMGKPMPLIVDHIDGHSENNRPENLRMVCGNCDMQLPTYKGKNVGNGRYSRRERMRAGKSF